MSFLCPACNGIQALVINCPTCKQTMQDSGRVDDYLGPYAPYRPIDDLKMTNGFTDFRTHICVHYVHCPSCQYAKPIQVQEWGHI